MRSVRPSAIHLALTVCVTLATGSISVAQSPKVGEGNLPGVIMARAFSNLTFKRPIGLFHAGDSTDRLFVLQQRGRIMVFENRSDISKKEVFLDLREKVRMKHNEEGLMALAFAPDYATSGIFYVHYSASDPRRGVISRFRVSSDDPNRADPDSEEIILEVEQPYGNHNGSTLVFGPDGYLYISLGDGGWANDPHGHGQNLSTLLGTILRIDVARTDDDLAYAIPADNPFVGRDDARGEIWAYGLRNIWRMSFDRETGELWAGDVGQNIWEEIDYIIKGGNYGWNIREGFHAFTEEQPENADHLLEPVVEYPHAEGLSITGGYVYRGSKNPRLVGAYLYADYVSGRIWVLRHEKGIMTALKLAHDPSRRRFISSFGEDEAGELYVCVFARLDGRGSGDGHIYVLKEN